MASKPDSAAQPRFSSGIKEEHDADSSLASPMLIAWEDKAVNPLLRLPLSIFQVVFLPHRVMPAMPSGSLVAPWMFALFMAVLCGMVQAWGGWLEAITLYPDADGDKSVLAVMMIAGGISAGVSTTVKLFALGWLTHKVIVFYRNKEEASWRADFRVLAYGLGVHALLGLVPPDNTFFNIVLFIWLLWLAFYGLAKVHRTTYGQVFPALACIAICYWVLAMVMEYLPAMLFRLVYSIAGS